MAAEQYKNVSSAYRCVTLFAIQRMMSIIIILNLVVHSLTMVGTQKVLLLEAHTAVYVTVFESVTGL